MNTNSNDNPKEKLAEENKQASEEAMRLAREAEERDRLSGQKPILTSVADAIKGKLEREDFKVAVDEDGQHVPARQPSKK